MRDQLILTGMRFSGHHGCSAEERAVGQTIVVDVELELDLSKSGRSDNLDDTINYVAVFDVIKNVVEGEPRKLIEAVAEGIAAKLLAGFSTIETVKTTVRKAAPADVGGFEVAVSSTRHA